MSKIDEFLERSKCAELGNDATCLEALSICRQAKDYPIILPWRSERNVHRWYLLAPADSSELVMDEVCAHIGVSHTDFDGRPQPVGPGDAAYTVLQELWPDAIAARITLTDVGAHETVAKGVLRLARRWTNRRLGGVDVPRDLQQLLRDHKMALLAGDEQECTTILNEMRHRGLLTPLNCLFLEFEQLARFATPSELLTHPQFGRLSGLRRPAALTDLIAKAINRAKIRPAGGENLSTAISNYRTLDAQYRGLLTSLGECRSTSGVLLVALHAEATGGKVRPQHFTFAIDELTRGALDLVESGEGDSSVDGSAEVLRERLNQGNYDAALEMAAVEPVTRAKVDAALFAAQQLNSIESAQRALAILASASEETQSEVAANPLLDRLITDLRQLVLHGDAIDLTAISSWGELLTAMVRHPEWDGPVELAAHGANEWGVLGGSAGGDADREVAALIRQLRADGHPFIDSVSTEFVSWFLRVEPEHGCGAISAVGVALLGYLTRSTSSAPEIRVACGMTDALLGDAAYGVDAATVLRLLDQRLGNGVPRSAAPAVLDVVAGLLAGTNSRSAEANSLGVSLLRQAATRIDAAMPSLRYLAVAVAQELGTALNVSDLVSEEELAATSVVVVGPEWLTERVTDAVSHSWPNVSAWGTTERALDVIDSGKLRSAGLVVLAPTAHPGATSVLEGVGLRPGALVRSASRGPAAYLVEIERWLATLV